jgi:hypothetical protein
MLLTIPFLYPAIVVKQRRTTRVHVVFASSVRVDIPELSYVDAPVSLEWEVERSGKALSVQVRHHDGQFHVPAGREPSSPPSGFLLERLAGWRGGMSGDLDDVLDLYGLHRQPDLRALTETMLRTGVVPEQDIKIASTFWSAEDECREALERSLAGLVSIEGQLWRQVHEPVLMMRTFEDGGERCSQLDVHYGPTAAAAFHHSKYGGSFKSPASTRFYAFDRLEDLLSEASSLPLHPRVDRLLAARVSMPEVLTFDRSADVVTRTVEWSAGTVHKLGQMRPDDVTISGLSTGIRLAREEFMATGDIAILEMAALNTLPAVLPYLDRYDTEDAADMRVCLSACADARISILTPMGRN